MERYVTTTYRLHEIHVCIKGGYVSSTYPKNKIDALNFLIKFFSPEFLVLCRRALYVFQLSEKLSTSLADVLRHSPSFWEGHSKPQFSFQFSGWRRCGRSWWQKIYSPGFIIRVERFVIHCRVGRLPSVNCADVHRGRRYRWRFWKLRW